MKPNESSSSRSLRRASVKFRKRSKSNKLQTAKEREKMSASQEKMEEQNNSLKRNRETIYTVLGERGEIRKEVRA